MGKTYHSKHEFVKHIGKEEKRAQKFIDAHGLINPFDGKYPIDTNSEFYKDNIDKYFDYLHFRRGIEKHVDQSEHSRHPDGTKASGLGKDLEISTRYWRNRYGEEHDKSSRQHLLKIAGTQQRRAKWKRQLKDIIDNIDND